jgi:uncharacterized protein YqiB (DUF1249 family)
LELHELCYAFFMVSFSAQNGLLQRPTLARLQDLQTEIYRQLQLLIPDQIAHYDSFRSCVHGSPLLRMDILERHPYTHFLRLTYQFEKNEHREIAPDAHIRIYNDAHMAEVTSFNPEQGFNRQPAGPDRSAEPLQAVCNGAWNGAPLHLLASSPDHQQLQRFQFSWRKNRALDKWLSYLIHQGHSITSMQPARDRISGKQVTPIKESVRST